MRDHRKRGSSVAVAALAGFGTLVTLTAIMVVAYTGSTSPKDVGLITAIAVAVEMIGLAIVALWKRMTRRGRKYRNSG
jgi:hypothetical protein